MIKLSQDQENFSWIPHNSTMRLRRVTVKQKHQMNMDQLLRSALQALSLHTGGEQLQQAEEAHDGHRAQA